MKSPIEAPEKYDYEDCRMPRSAAETGVRIPLALQKRMAAGAVATKKVAAE